MAAPPTPLPDDLASPRAIVLYATMFGATEAVAERVAELLSAELGYQVPCRDVAWYELAQLSKYDLLVIGSSTWNIGQLPSDLELHLPDLAELDLHGKLLALFGTGDQVGYPDTYLDALEIIADALELTGVELIGQWPTDGYDFIDSRALKDGELLGLGVDEDNEPELTAERVAAWVKKVLADYRRTAPLVRLLPH